MSQLVFWNSGLLTYLDPCSLGDAPTFVKTTALLTIDVLGEEVSGVEASGSELARGGLHGIAVSIDGREAHQVLPPGHGVVEGVDCAECGEPFG